MCILPRGPSGPLHLCSLLRAGAILPVLPLACVRSVRPVQSAPAGPMHMHVRSRCSSVPVLPESWLSGRMAYCPVSPLSELPLLIDSGVFSPSPVPDLLLSARGRLHPPSWHPVVQASCCGGRFAEFLSGAARCPYSLLPTRDEGGARSRARDALPSSPFCQFSLSKGTALGPGATWFSSQLLMLMSSESFVTGVSACRGAAGGIWHSVSSAHISTCACKSPMYFAFHSQRAHLRSLLGRRLHLAPRDDRGHVHRQSRVRI